MIPRIDLTGKRAFIVGAENPDGYGWRIAKALHMAGASVMIGVWPNSLQIFNKQLKSGRLDEARKHGCGLLEFRSIFPIDLDWDGPGDVPESVKGERRYAAAPNFTISECAEAVKAYLSTQGASTYQPEIDILVHSVANAPEINRPLRETTRAGYMKAQGTSAYSLISLVQNFAPLMSTGAAVISISYLASTRIVRGYGGGMDAAKAGLEANSRKLAAEFPKFHFHCVSPGPLASVAAKSIGNIDAVIKHYRENAPGDVSLGADQVACLVAFLATPMAWPLNASTIMADYGYHAVGMPPVLQEKVPDADPGE